MGLSVDKESVTAGQPVSVTATVEDANGNRISGLDIVFASPTCPQASPIGSVKTDGLGQATSLVTFTQSGQQVVMASYQNIMASAAVTVKPVDPSNLPPGFNLVFNSLNLSPNVIALGQPTVLTGKVSDNYHNPVPNVSVTAQTTGDWGADPTVTTQEDGSFVITIKPNKTGTFPISLATSGESRFDTGLTLGVTTTRGYTLTFVGGPESAVAGIPATYRVKLADQSGAPVPNAELTFQSPTDASADKLTGPETDNSGETSADFTFYKSGPQTLCVTWPSQPNVSCNMSVGVVSSSPAQIKEAHLSHTQIQVDSSVIISGVVQDAYGNLITSGQVTIKTINGTDQPLINADIQENGSFVAAVNVPNAGIVNTFLISDGSAVATVGPLTVIPKPPALTVMPLTATSIADVNIPYSLLATLKDSDGNPISGVPVELKIPTDPDALYPPSVLTDDSGEALFTVQFSQVHNQTLQFSSLANGKTMNSTLYLYSAIPNLGNFIYQSVTPTSGQAGTSVEVRGFVYDQFGNPMPPNTSVSVTLPGSNAANQTVFTDNQGLFTATLTPTKVGSFTLTCTVEGQTFPYGTNINVSAGPPSSGTLLCGSSSIQMGNYNTVSIHLVDAWGNNVPDTTVILETNAPVTLTQPPKTDAYGNASVSVGPFNAIGIYYFYSTSPAFLMSPSFGVHDTKFVTVNGSNYASSGSVPSTYEYNSGGYVGTLNRDAINSVVVGGSYIPPDSKTATATRSVSFTTLYRWNGTSWFEFSTTWSPDLPTINGPYYYSSGGYTGNLYLSFTSNQTYKYYDLPSNPVLGQIVLYEDGAGIANYSGTVTKPASDTRVYNYYGVYSGYVTKNP
ncbi:Ig-like domain-containing protein [Desulfitobacterium sp. AusDCA]|uniref:Ig-like domain-containing protein n=1 Tax=Desulfitobacterium sp. AusDCA TaxID=3240383 RepID=UPI003DA70170